MDTSVIDPNEPLSMGWGIHIIEGPNKFAIYCATLCIILISGLVAILWAVIRHDIQGGFGIGAWMTSVLGLILMIYSTKWGQE
jgi:hypothetical protein